MTFELVESRRLCEGVIVSLDRVVYRAPDGREVVRDVVGHPGGVAVLPIDGDETVMVRQHRAGAGRWLLEIPAGKRDQDGEDPRALAIRELREEVGMEARTLTSLGDLYVSPAYCAEMLRIYVAEDITPVERAPDGVEEDHAEVVRMPLETAVSLAATGEIEDAKTVAALLRWDYRRRVAGSR